VAGEVSGIPAEVQLDPTIDMDNLVKNRTGHNATELVLAASCRELRIQHFLFYSVVLPVQLSC
jgi:hypothetical protein